MQETKILYTANEKNIVWGRIFRWADVLAFLGIILAISIVFSGAISSGNPAALSFIRVSAWGMGIAIGVVSLMMMINAFGRWGWLGLVPIVLIGTYWFTGSLGDTIFVYWGEVFSYGGEQVLRIALYALGGLTGLGLLARLIEKVGVGGFLATLAIAAGISFWFVG